MNSSNTVQMAWNEPGGGKKDKDQNPNNPWGKDREPGPPDLDQLFRKLKEQLKKAFGQKKKRGSSGSPFGFGSGGGVGNSSSGGSGSSGSEGKGNNSQNAGSSFGTLGSGFGNFFGEQKEFQTLALVVVIALGLLYLLSGIYIVDPPERAVVTRFGKYVRTEGPGPHWLPMFIEDREIVNVEQVATSDQSGSMLTKDRNIASVGIAVQYRIGDGVDDVRAFLFNVVNPVHSLKQSAESALRQVIGQYTMDEVLTYKRSEIASAIKEQIVETIRNYHTGILVLDVAMQYAKAPDEVRAAFDDVIKAAADEERLINQARAYENEVLPRAKGNVEKLRNEAMAYKQQTVLKAEGNVQRFNLILPEYQKASKVTQTRLYLDTMEQILSRVSKVLSDPNAGNNFIYMPPFERFMRENAGEESESIFSGGSNKDAAAKDSLGKESSGRDPSARDTGGRDSGTSGRLSSRSSQSDNSKTVGLNNAPLQSNGRIGKEKSS